MSIINFPQNPSLYELYPFGGKTWQWNGSYWGIYSGTSLSIVDINYSASTGELWYTKSDLSQNNTSKWSYFTGGSYNTSTRESKTNIKSIDDISWINELNPVSFNYRKKEDYTTYIDEYFEETSYGLIADEVEKVNSDFVFYNIDEQGNKKLAGVEYNHFISVLIKGYQELSAKVTALENK